MIVNYWKFVVPISHLLIRISRIQNRRLLQRVANELQADGQTPAVKTAGDGEAAADAEVERQGENSESSPNLNDIKRQRGLN